MAKTKSKRSRIILITLLLLGVVLAVWYVTRPKAAAPKVASTQSTGTSASNTDSKKTDATIDKDKDAPATSSNTTTSSSNNKLYIVVNRPVNNDTLKLADGIQVRSTVTGATSGTCSLKLTGPNNKTVNKSASITAQTSYGSCSFDVAGSELSAGEWTMTLTATSGDANATYTAKVTMQ